MISLSLSSSLLSLSSLFSLSLSRVCVDVCVKSASGVRGLISTDGIDLTSAYLLQSIGYGSNSEIP